VVELDVIQIERIDKVPRLFTRTGFLEFGGVRAVAAFKMKDLADTGEIAVRLQTLEVSVSDSINFLMGVKDNGLHRISEAVKSDELER